MVERIRAEGRKIAPEALTKHHLWQNQTQTGGNAEETVTNVGAEENRTGTNVGAEENRTGTNIGEESPQEEAKNVLASLIKRLSDQTRFELVRSRPE